MIKRFLHCPRAVTGAVLTLILLSGAVFAPWLAPHDPYEQCLVNAFMPPSPEYPMGTDDFGRCTFSRVLWGGRISLTAGIATTLISAFIGVPLGLIAGFAGGKIDRLIMDICDVFLAFPGLIIALAIAGIMGPGIVSIVAALSSVGWMGYTRIVRSKVLAEREQEYIKAAKAMGVKKKRIRFRYLLPAVMPSVLILLGTGVGRNILATASLSFLGVGVRKPVAEWGSMLSAGKDYIYRSIYMTLFPGAAIMLSVLAFNTLGEGLREILDPKNQTESCRIRRGYFKNMNTVKSKKGVEL